ncbi:MAG: hypothetical protein MJB12_18325 [Firmicutes bacterium]|nr:hypothetical protein [Bacillota bacterium]
MIKVIMGQRGTGKSKKIIELANQAVKEDLGDIVYINSNNRHMYELDHNIRFVNVSEFAIADYCMFYGFICGIISEDFDISQIYIDGITRISDNDSDSFEKFLKDIVKISNKFNVTFTFTVSGEPEQAPPYLKEYLCTVS